MARETDKPSLNERRPDDRPRTARSRLGERLSRVSKRGWLITLAASLGVILLAYWLWPSKKAAAEDEEAANIVVSVRVAKAERGTISAETTVMGTIFPREQAAVSPKINAQIKSMALLKNKAVRAGDVIATLEARDLQAQRAEAAAALQEAQANLRLLSGGTIPEANVQDEKAVRTARASVDNARATYDRRKMLFEQGGISQKDLEAAELALTTAENDLRAAEAAARLHQTATNPGNREAATARVKQAADRLANLDTQLSYAVIRAPFAGVITDQFQFEGEYAAAGAKLVNIADVSEVIVKAPISDTVAADLKDGDPVTVLPQESPDEKIEAQISLISRASDPQNRAVEIWVKLENKNGQLRANSAAKVAVTTGTSTDTIIVPAAAVTLEATNANQGTVMVVEKDPATQEDVAHERKVTVGVRTADQTEITSGLKEGETVVTEGNYALPDKTKVEINTSGDEEDEGEKEEGGATGGAASGRETPSPSEKSSDNGAQPNQPDSGSRAQPGQRTPATSTPKSETPPHQPAGAAPPSPSGKESKPQGGEPKSSTGSQSSPNTKAGSGAKPATQPGGKP